MFRPVRSVASHRVIVTFVTFRFRTREEGTFIDLRPNERNTPNTQKKSLLVCLLHNLRKFQPILINRSLKCLQPTEARFEDKQVELFRRYEQKSGQSDLPVTFFKQIVELHRIQTYLEIESSV